MELVCGSELVLLCDQDTAVTWCLLAEAGATLQEARALKNAMERTN